MFDGNIGGAVRGDGDTNQLNLCFDALHSAVAAGHPVDDG